MRRASGSRIIASDPVWTRVTPFVSTAPESPRDVEGIGGLPACADRSGGGCSLQTSEGGVDPDARLRDVVGVIRYLSSSLARPVAKCTGAPSLASPTTTLAGEPTTTSSAAARADTKMSMIDSPMTKTSEEAVIDTQSRARQRKSLGSVWFH